MKKILYVPFLLLTLSSQSFAQDAKTWRVSAGVGVGFKKNLRVENRYEDMDKKVLTKTIPMIQGSIGRFSLGAQGISVRAVGNHMMNLSAFIKRDGDRYQGYGMAPRKDSAFVGLSAKFLQYGLSVSKDINGRSKGMITQLSYGEMFPLTESLVLRAGLSAEWMDDKYAEYYYSVRYNEATANRREYHLDSYFQFGFNIMPMYKISEKISVIAALSFKLVPEKVRNSPTMNGDKVEISGITGISYNF
jgi:outer membrane protein